MLKIVNFLDHTIQARLNIYVVIPTGPHFILPGNGCVWLLVNYGAGEGECGSGNTAALHQHNEDKQWSTLIPLLQVIKLLQHSIPIRTGGSQDQEQRKLLLFLFCYVLLLLLWIIWVITGSWFSALHRIYLDIYYSFGSYFHEGAKCSACAVFALRNCTAICSSHSMELLFTSLNFATVDSTLICHDSFITWELLWNSLYYYVFISTNYL